MSEQLSEIKNEENVVRRESTLRTDSSRYNQSTQNAQTMHEKLNTAMNWNNIIEAIKSGGARDINDELKAPVNEHGEKMPCIIIGSGPSLDDAIPYLKEWKGGIICTTSHALTLMYYGIEPTYIMALDAFSLWDEIKGVDWNKTKTKLITHPGVWPELIEKWPNEILLYIENNGKTDSFYSTTQKIMYSHREGGTLREPVFHYYIRTEVTLFACSPPIQLFIMDILGYGTVYNCGLDWGYDPKKNKKRFTSYDFDSNGIWQEHKKPFVMHDRIIVANNGMMTEEVHVYYKKNYLSAWKLCGKTMYSTDHGILVEVPFIDIKDVVACQGYGMPQQSKEFIADCVEPYLALVGAFVLETEQGMSFVESQNPSVDLVAFMHEILRRYVCDGACKAKIMFNDPNDKNDHEGDECPQCHQGKLSHEIEIDIKKNMERIEARIEQAKLIKIKE
jgi:hypothetical protein